MNEQPADNSDYSGMTKAQLLEYADENGINGVNSRMNKAEIINTIVSSEG